MDMVDVLLTPKGRGGPVAVVGTATTKIRKKKDEKKKEQQKTE
jgi:hypothetical protein